MPRWGFACIALALAMPAAAADSSLGRLFFTPSQRALLDVARSQRTKVTVATEATEATVEVSEPVPQTITYDGMVRRSDGRTTVWLNNRPVDDRKPADESMIIRRVRPDGAVTLEVPQASRRVDLKVGQSVEVLSGSIGEGYRQRPTVGVDAPTEKETKNKGTVKDMAEKGTSRGEGEGQGSESRDSAAAPEPRATNSR